MAKADFPPEAKAYWRARLDAVGRAQSRYLVFLIAAAIFYVAFAAGHEAEPRSGRLLPCGQYLHGSPPAATRPRRGTQYSTLRPSANVKRTRA